MYCKTKPKFFKNLLVAAALTSLLLVAGCGTKYTGEYITDQKLENNLEYVADVIVNKEGYSFLWCIPLASASEDAAKAMMEEVVKKRYPDAAGVFEYEVVQQKGVGLFDWKPTFTARGKVARIPKQ